MQATAPQLTAQSPHSLFITSTSTTTAPPSCCCTLLYLHFVSLTPLAPFILHHHHFHSFSTSACCYSCSACFFSHSDRSIIGWRCAGEEVLWVFCSSVPVHNTTFANKRINVDWKLMPRLQNCGSQEREGHGLVRLPRGFLSFCSAGAPSCDILHLLFCRVWYAFETSWEGTNVVRDWWWNEFCWNKHLFELVFQLSVALMHILSSKWCSIHSPGLETHRLWIS